MLASKPSSAAGPKCFAWTAEICKCYQGSKILNVNFLKAKRRNGYEGDICGLSATEHESVSAQLHFYLIDYTCNKLPPPPRGLRKTEGK